MVGSTGLILEADLGAHSVSANQRRVFLANQRRAFLANQRRAFLVFGRIQHRVMIPKKKFRPNEAQWAKRCLLSLLFPSPSPSTVYYQYTLFQTKLPEIAQDTQNFYDNHLIASPRLFRWRLAFTEADCSLCSLSVRKLFREQCSVKIVSEMGMRLTTVLMCRVQKRKTMTKKMKGSDPSKSSASKRLQNFL